MTSTLTALDAEAMAQARVLLETPVRRARMWPVLTAAAALAVSALTRRDDQRPALDGGAFRPRPRRRLGHRRKLWRFRHGTGHNP
jgi:hypothetical protein